jgi:hypothetical protein
MDFEDTFSLLLRLLTRIQNGGLSELEQAAVKYLAELTRQILLSSHPFLSAFDSLRVLSIASI